MHFIAYPSVWNWTFYVVKQCNGSDYMPIVLYWSCNWDTCRWVKSVLLALVSNVNYTQGKCDYARRECWSTTSTIGINAKYNVTEVHSTTYHRPRIQPQLQCQCNPASTLALHWCQDQMNHLSGLYSAGVEWDGTEWNGILQGWFEFTRGSPVFISGMIAT